MKKSLEKLKIKTETKAVLVKTQSKALRAVKTSQKSKVINITTILNTFIGKAFNILKQNSRLKQIETMQQTNNRKLLKKGLRVFTKNDLQMVLDGFNKWVLYIKSSKYKFKNVITKASSKYFNCYKDSFRKLKENVALTENCRKHEQREKIRLTKGKKLASIHIKETFYRSVVVSFNI